MTTDVARLRALLDQATAAPWFALSRGGDEAGTDSDTLGWQIRGHGDWNGEDDGPPEPYTGRGQFARWADAALIAESRNALPELLDALDAATSRAEAAEQRAQRNAVAAMAGVGTLEWVIDHHECKDDPCSLCTRAHAETWAIYPVVASDAQAWRAAQRSEVPPAPSDAPDSHPGASGDGS